MIKKITQLLAAIALFVFAVPNQSKASHMMGADIYFTCQGNNLYQFTLVFYRDCAGISAPSSVSMSIAAASCGLSSSITLNQVGAGIEVSPLCPAMIAQSSCNGGSLPGVQQFVYQGSVVLPFACNDYVFSWTDCCRNAAITNVPGASGYGMYVEAHYDNTVYTCDHAPTFTTIPVPYICSNQPFNYNQGAIDADGDSLVYTMINPMDAGAVPVPYNAPFNATYPLSTTTGSVVFDPLSGQLSFTPNANQITIMAIKVDEYRNGTWIGSTMRDIQLVVITCNNTPPLILNGGIQNQQGGVNQGAMAVDICPGQSLSFYVSVTDTNAADTIYAYSNIAAVIPGATFNVVGGDTVNAYFSWTPTIADTGYYVFTYTVMDNACPIYGQQVFSFTINVPASTSAGPDLSICYPQTSVQLNAVGGNTFVWTPNTALSNDSISNPIASPTVTTTYYVTSDLSSSCHNTDTVVVFVLPQLVLNPTANPDSICNGAQTHLFSNISGGSSGNYNVSWTSNVGGFTSSQNNPFASPTSTTTYYLAVTSGQCAMNDSTTVVVRPVPSATFNASPSGVCINQHTNIQFTGSPGSGFIYNWNFGNANVVSGSGGGPYDLFWTSPGSKSITVVVTDPLGCTGTSTITVTVFPDPVATFTASPMAGCDPFTVYFNNNSTGASTYVWTFGDGSANGTLQNPNHVYSTGNYDITLVATSNNGCSDTITNTNLIHVIPTPIAGFTISPDPTYPVRFDLTQSNFTFTNTSQNADAYLWLFGDGDTSHAFEPTHTYTDTGHFTVTLIAYNVYCSDTFRYSYVVVYEFDQIYFANAFTPNGDGVNDTWHELGIEGVTTLNYRIYNRWGQLIFETNDKNTGWDGTYNGADCEVGVYTYYAKAVMINGKVVEKKGNITLMR